MTSLKKNGLLRTYYRDRLRGYRLGAKAKAALLDGWPERFSPYLTGDTDTNRLKSEVNRRLRLHRLAETYVTMDNAGIGLFQDEKPKVFSPQGYHGEAIEYWGCWMGKPSVFPRIPASTATWPCTAPAEA